MTPAASAAAWSFSAALSSCFSTWLRSCLTRVCRTPLLRAPPWTRSMRPCPSSSSRSLRTVISEMPSSRDRSRTEMVPRSSHRATSDSCRSLFNMSTTPLMPIVALAPRWPRVGLDVPSLRSCRARGPSQRLRVPSCRTGAPFQSILHDAVHTFAHKFIPLAGLLTYLCPTAVDEQLHTF